MFLCTAVFDGKIQIVIDLFGRCTQNVLFFCGGSFTIFGLIRRFAMPFGGNQLIFNTVGGQAVAAQQFAVAVDYQMLGISERYR